MDKLDKLEMIMEALDLRAKLKDLAERGIEAAQAERLQESIDLMTEAAPIIERLAELSKVIPGLDEGGEPWAGLADKGKKLLDRAKSFQQ
ncbi:MAG TPA: hypothetical protein VIY48_16055 [Candidatus Paceibacterota bacterium]